MQTTVKITENVTTPASSAPPALAFGFGRRYVEGNCFCNGNSCSELTSAKNVIIKSIKYLNQWFINPFDLK